MLGQAAGSQGLSPAAQAHPSLSPSLPPSLAGGSGGSDKASEASLHTRATVRSGVSGRKIRVEESLQGLPSAQAQALSPSSRAGDNFRGGTLVLVHFLLLSCNP